MSQLGTKQPKYKDGRTKQSFRDETDINQILKRAQTSGTISHLNKYEARYGDFSGFDFFEAQLKISQGREIFDELPVELRREFNQSPAEFFDFVNKPENVDRVGKILPALAAPGRQNLKTEPPKADESTVLEAKEIPPEAVIPDPPEIPANPAPAASEPPSTGTT